MTSEDWTLKELVSALLALLLVGSAIALMYQIANLEGSASQDHYHRLSGLLQVAVGLAGTATGYYFGRVPAEKTAVAAQKSANEAHKSLVDATENAGKSAVTVDRLATANRSASDQLKELKRVLTSPTPVGGADAGMHARGETAARIDRILETLS